MTSEDSIGRLRLAALRLVGERFPTVREAARWLCAAQGQDLPGALESLAMRAEGGSTDAVRAAFDAGEIVRAWPMRSRRRGRSPSRPSRAGGG